MQAPGKDPAMEHFPAMNRLLREQLVGRTVIDLLIDRDRTVIALDNGGILEIPGLCLAFSGPRG